MATVYKIENPIGQVYIGSTMRDEILTRRNEHKYGIKRGRKGLLYDSFEVFGFENHTFSIIANCPKEDARELEHFIIKEFNTELNTVKDHNATAVGKVWVNNGVVEFQVDQDSIPQGFKRGRKPNNKLGRKRYINN